MKAISLVLLLSGCAVVNPDYIRSQTTAQICTELMSLPAYNLNHPARYRELERRGASCASPAEIAAGQQRANDQALGAAILLSPPVNCTTIHNGNIAQTVCR